MTFTYELDPYYLAMYPVCKYELPTLKRQTDRQTYKIDRNYIPCRFRRFVGGDR